MQIPLSRNSYFSYSVKPEYFLTDGFFSIIIGSEIGSSNGSLKGPAELSIYYLLISSMLILLAGGSGVATGFVSTSGWTSSFV